MYKEEKIIRRTATASEKKAIIDFLDSINANPLTIAQAEDIKVEECEYKEAILEILNGFEQFCEDRDCEKCVFEETSKCCKISIDTLKNYVKSL